MLDHGLWALLHPMAAKVPGGWSCDVPEFNVPWSLQQVLRKLWLTTDLDKIMVMKSKASRSEFASQLTKALNLPLEAGRLYDLRTYCAKGFTLSITCGYGC